VTAPAAPAVTRSPRAVALVSGKIVTVQTAQEADWFEETRNAYLNELKFTEKTDLIDLDRMLMLELMVFRWSNHLAAGTDYDGDMVNEKQLTADLKLYSDQLNKVKESMGLAKKARDAAENEGNFSAWLSDLKSRAKIFGIHREKQVTKALALMNELSTVVGAFDRSDEEERRKLGFDTEKEIVDWVRETMLPEYHALDAYFREHEQRYWVRDQ
jgi:hypothetical protein